MYRQNAEIIEVFLVHPGGPFWAKKDNGSWSIPKGEFTDEEDPLSAAKREFEEETGQSVSGNFISLIPIKQKSGKLIFAWLIKGDIDHLQIRSNLFEMEWPPRSGKLQTFPEIDRGAWFTIHEAKAKLLPGQIGFLDEMMRIIMGYESMSFS